MRSLVNRGYGFGGRTFSLSFKVMWRECGGGGDLQCPLMAVASGGRRNTVVKSVCRGLEPQSLAWPFIESTGDLI